MTRQEKLQGHIDAWIKQSEQDSKAFFALTQYFMSDYLKDRSEELKGSETKTLLEEEEFQNISEALVKVVENGTPKKIRDISTLTKLFLTYGLAEQLFEDKLNDISAPALEAAIANNYTDVINILLHHLYTTNALRHLLNEDNKQYWNNITKEGDNSTQEILKTISDKFINSSKFLTSSSDNNAKLAQKHVTPTKNPFNFYSDESLEEHGKGIIDFPDDKNTANQDQAWDEAWKDAVNSAKNITHNEPEPVKHDQKHNASRVSSKVEDTTTNKSLLFKLESNKLAEPNQMDGPIKHNKILPSLDHNRVRRSGTFIKSKILSNIPRNNKGYSKLD
jgi:hypothetical protein